MLKKENREYYLVGLIYSWTHMHLSWNGVIIFLSHFLKTEKCVTNHNLKKKGGGR